LIHEAPLGVKWKWTHGCRSSHSRTAGVVWVDELSMMTGRPPWARDGHRGEPEGDSMTTIVRQGRFGCVLIVVAIVSRGRVEASPRASGGDDDETPVGAGTRPATQPRETPAPAPMAVDPEEPRRPSRRGAEPARGGQLRPSSWPDEERDERALRKPACGLMFELGIGGGGDDLVKVSLSDGSTQTLSAGDGVAVSLGLMCTPIWVGDNFGAGISGTIGYKGWSVGGSNGDIGMTRFPMTAAVHLLQRVAPRWLLLARGGIDKEVNVSISGSGVAQGTSADLNARLGGFGEAGFYYILDTLEQRGAWSLTFRYTQLTYTANGGSADGQSFMVFSTLYFNP